MRSVRWLIAGFALYKLSDLLEGFGDLAPYATDGVSGERLAFHGTALVVLLIGFACFVRALVLAWRTIRGGGKAEARAVAAVFDDGDEGSSEFDADAALARYLEKRAAPEAGAAPITGPRGSGFGRRGL